MGSTRKCHYKLCCFCIPLIIGLLLWGYFNVVACVLFICAIELGIRTLGINEEGVLRGPLYAVLLLDIGFHLAFIVGAHKKQAILLKVYFYYGVANVGLAAGILILSFTVLSYFSFESVVLLWAIPICIVPAILVNVYFLVLVKYEVWKVNHSHRELDKVVYTERIENEGVEEAH